MHNIGQMNTLVLIVLEQFSEVYLYSILLLKQISTRRIIQFRQTDFTRLIATNLIRALLSHCKNKFVNSTMLIVIFIYSSRKLRVKFFYL